MNKLSKKGYSFFLPKGNLNSKFNINDRSSRKFPSSTPPCSQDFCHELSLISEEIDSMDKIINQSIESFRQDNPNEYVSIEAQTCNQLSADYINIAVGPNDVFSVMVVRKSAGTEFECYQLVDSLRETIDLLKVELKDKGATISNLYNIFKNLTVNENKLDGSCEQQAMKVCSKDNDDNDIVRELLQTDQLHHRLQKLKDQPQNSAETPSIYLGVD